MSGSNGGPRTFEAQLSGWFEDVVVGRRPGLGPALVRALLAPLSLLYSAFIEGYKLLFQLGVLKRVVLPCRVVSIGNLTLGGSGKTVAVQSLVRALQRGGLRCAVLSYGYRSTVDAPYAVVSDESGVRLSAEEAGDEAALLAQSLPGAPVVIGKRRAVSGAAAVRLFQPDIVVLDDGFQHWRLHRDADLVLLDARRPLGSGRVFPAGDLRERPQSLSRATACLLTRCNLASAAELKAAQEVIEKNAPDIPRYQTVHRPAPLRQAAGTSEFRPDQVGSNEAPFMLVSGIRQNDDFVRTVRSSGIAISKRHFFPDHHRYTSSDVTGILHESECAGVLTTEKDAVKLASLWQARTPLVVAPVELEGITDQQWWSMCGVVGAE